MFDDVELVGGVQRLGRYQLVRRLGIGGMAELYLARSSGIEGFEKLVTVKRIRPDMAHDGQLIRMFLDEARLAARLQHANVAQVFDVGEAEGSYFFAMEYVEGHDLAHILKAAGALPIEHALYIAIGVAAGLHYAHERLDGNGRPLEIVHRDVSPSNILVTWDGGVKLVDFGIAKARLRSTVTRAGYTKGKLQYMSPEQAAGVTVDRRSDVYSLGLVLREMLGGTEPPAIEALLDRAIAYTPDGRYSSAQALQLELEAFVRDARLQCSPVSLARYLTGLLGAPGRPETPASSPAVVAASTETPAMSQPSLSPTTSRPHASRRGLIVAGTILAVAIPLAIAIFFSLVKDAPAAAPRPQVSAPPPSLPAVVPVPPAPAPASASASPPAPVRHLAPDKPRPAAPRKPAKKPKPAPTPKAEPKWSPDDPLLPDQARHLEGGR
jgi:serine/threonine protein kinase